MAIYVEYQPAKDKATQLQQEGFFQDKSDGHICSLLVQPGFKKVLQLRLLRDVSTSRFTSELSKDLVRTATWTPTCGSVQQVNQSAWPVRAELATAGRHKELLHLACI